MHKYLIFSVKVAGEIIGGFSQTRKLISNKVFLPLCQSVFACR